MCDNNRSVWDRAPSPAAETPLARSVARNDMDFVRAWCRCPDDDDIAVLEALYDRAAAPAQDPEFRGWERDQLEFLQSALLVSIRSLGSGP